MEWLFFLVLAWLPGIVAEQRQHRHAMLVSLLGFVALWIHPIVWLLALYWAWKGAPKLTPE